MAGGFTKAMTMRIRIKFSMPRQSLMQIISRALLLSIKVLIIIRLLLKGLDCSIQMLPLHQLTQKAKIPLKGKINSNKAKLHNLIQSLSLNNKLNPHNASHLKSNTSNRIQTLNKTNN